MKYPKALQNLIDQFSCFPSVGPKTAERYAFYLLKQNPEKSKSLALAISELSEKIIICHECLAIAESDPCPICADKNRRAGILCVVEDLQDMVAIETTKQYDGRYLILGGLINVINEVRPENLNIEKLIKKIKAENIQEIILALNFTLEGESTALYLTKIFKNQLKISRLAKGLPAGSNLEYADELTLGSALKNRNEIK
ncbi:MAG: recombination mediator RecR [Patescibacteria group bacterium]|jgi:recombination protein RecR